MKSGDKIRVFNCFGDTEDYIVEEFRYCLGIFATENHRIANEFTPLCAIYEKGAYSEEKYLSNFGKYYSNPVQAWMDLPKDVN